MRTLFESWYATTGWDPTAQWDEDAQMYAELSLKQTCWLVWQAANTYEFQFPTGEKP